MARRGSTPAWDVQQLRRSRKFHSAGLPKARNALSAKCLQTPPRARLGRQLQTSTVLLASSSPPMSACPSGEKASDRMSLLSGGVDVLDQRISSVWVATLYTA